MNCDETQVHIYTYIDGEAGVWRRWRIRRHVRECPPCEKAIVFESRLKIRVREGCREEMPRELEQRLRAFLHQHETDGTEA